MCFVFLHLQTSAMLEYEFLFIAHIVWQGYVCIQSCWHLHHDRVFQYFICCWKLILIITQCCKLLCRWREGRVPAMFQASSKLFCLLSNSSIHIVIIMCVFLKHFVQIALSTEFILINSCIYLILNILSIVIQTCCSKMLIFMKSSFFIICVWLVA